jgi:hypothetical protein
MEVRVLWQAREEYETRLDSRTLIRPLKMVTRHTNRKLNAELLSCELRPFLLYYAIPPSVVEVVRRVNSHDMICPKQHT